MDHIPSSNCSKHWTKISLLDLDLITKVCDYIFTCFASAGQQLLRIVVVFVVLVVVGTKLNYLRHWVFSAIDVLLVVIFVVVGQLKFLDLPLII